MADPQSHPGLDSLADALASGDMDAVRSTLPRLSDEERAILEAKIGADAVARLYAQSRRARRGLSRGRVVVINGIMGAMLDSVGSDGVAQRIWMKLWCIARGKFSDLALTPDGGPADPNVQVRVSGMLDEYLPILAELGTQWDVLPFPFDWRVDVTKSADALADRIQQWAHGAPVHIVAHSMGGLVSRSFIKRHPDVWQSMQDKTGGGRGGRLIMLGTPNRGSFAIPLVLTGQEKSVKMLALADIIHPKRRVLEIIGGFVGCYQMMPSPLSDAPDDRRKLFDAKTWGTYPVQQAHLTTGSDFQKGLDAVVEPARMIYVAGYDRPTPCRVRVDGPGDFSFQQTLDGDGRVPHDLGLLANVPTYWIDEVHGDLPKNRSVLEGIHDLLSSGMTKALVTSRPMRRGVGLAPEWHKPVAFEPVAPEFEALAKASRGTTRGQPRPAVTSELEAAHLETVMLREWVGGPSVPAPSRQAAGVPAKATARGKAGDGKRAKLTIEVEWGDITTAKGDVYIAGHYENVLPQFAELALDKVVSDMTSPGSELLLTNLTRRGILRGALGDIYFYPWATKGAGRRLVAIAGMGHPGAFGPTQLRFLARNLALAVMPLPNVTRVCTVLIGAGVGNLSTETAVESLIHGLVEAVEMTGNTKGIKSLRFVEMQLERAHAIHRRLQKLQTESDISKRMDLTIGPHVHTGTMTRLGWQNALALTLASASEAARAPASAPAHKALERLLAGASPRAEIRKQAAGTLGGLLPHKGASVNEIASRLEVSEVKTAAESRTPARISFVSDGASIRAAALTQTAVIPERLNSVDRKLLDEAVLEMIDPDPERVPTLAALLSRLIVPRDFRELLKVDDPIVFEVDRTVAAVHWEMIARSVDGNEPAKPLALCTQVARQLRTTYAPPPTFDGRRSGALRALVIGDPGDPTEGNSLPGARDEALKVVEILRAKGVEVDAMIGAPNVPREGALRDIPAATRLHVLGKLMEGGFDLLHYCGHGDFDQNNPDRSGWVFQGGILSSRELERIDMAPRLVVANACLSALTSQKLARGTTVGGTSLATAPTGSGQAASMQTVNNQDGGTQPGGPRTEADLLPGLADEFFRRGVRNYIGTAWQISDVGAVVFAEEFYNRLIRGPDGEGGETIGASLLGARKELADDEAKYAALWAAYQHYGDPTQLLSPADDTNARAAPPPARRASTRRHR
jgi:pimeloyl-ACP methyl ester carboxylesterase